MTQYTSADKANDNVIFTFEHFNTPEKLHMKVEVIEPQLAEFRQKLEQCFKSKYVAVDQIVINMSYEDGHPIPFNCEARIESHGAVMYVDKHEGTDVLKTIRHAVKGAVDEVRRLKDKKADHKVGMR
jgi:prolyl oligopeptidase PreP (S9A serine peptidase family)